MPCRHCHLVSAHRTLTLLAVFDDRPSIFIFAYLLRDGFLTSSGDMALLPLYVLAFMRLPLDHTTDAPILVQSVYYIKTHIFIAFCCPLPVSLFRREHLPEMNGAMAGDDLLLPLYTRAARLLFSHSFPCLLWSLVAFRTQRL